MMKCGQRRKRTDNHGHLREIAEMDIFVSSVRHTQGQYHAGASIRIVCGTLDEFLRREERNFCIHYPVYR